MSRATGEGVCSQARLTVLARSARIIDNLRCLNPAPSVQMQETPRNPLNPAELDVSDDEDSDLDERINREL